MDSATDRRNSGFDVLTRVLGVSAGPVGGRGHTLRTGTDVAERCLN